MPPLRTERSRLAARFNGARSRRPLVLLAALLLVTPVGLACSSDDGAAHGGKPGGGKSKGKGRGKGGPGGPGGSEEAALAVEFIAVERGDIVRAYQASGTLTAILQAEIRPTQSGIIDVLKVEEGDTVKQDQLLAELDAREASLLARRDSLTAKNAAMELERLEVIAARAAASTQEVDQQRFALESALASARISKHQARQSKVRAPFDGTITSRLLDVGNFASSADVLFVLADLSVLELAVHIPEREAARVENGAKVQLENLANERFEGVVIRRAPVVDPLTGTVKFTVHVKGERPLSAVPGAFTRAAVELEAVHDVITVPDSALVEIDQAFFVYRIEGGADEGKAERIAVQVGLRGQERSEIVSGLEAGTWIVAETREITDGMLLKRFGAPKADAASGAPPEGKGPTKAGPHAQGEAKADATGKGKGKDKAKGKAG